MHVPATHRRTAQVIAAALVCAGALATATPAASALETAAAPIELEAEDAMPCERRTGERAAGVPDAFTLDGVPCAVEGSP